MGSSRVLGFVFLPLRGRRFLVKMRLSVAACTHPQRVHKDAHSLTGWILAEVKTEIALNLVTPDIFCFILLPGSLTHFIPF